MSTGGVLRIQVEPDLKFMKQDYNLIAHNNSIAAGDVLFRVVPNDPQPLRPAFVHRSFTDQYLKVLVLGPTKAENDSNNKKVEIAGFAGNPMRISESEIDAVRIDGQKQVIALVSGTIDVTVKGRVHIAQYIVWGYDAPTGPTRLCLKACPGNSDCGKRVGRCLQVKSEHKDNSGKPDPDKLYTVNMQIILT